MRAWQVVRHGRPTRALELVDAPDLEPAAGEILVQTSASVCNYNEVDGCHGRYLTIDPPLPYTLGMECVGEVVAAGPDAEHWLGKRVTATGQGGLGAHAERVVCAAGMTFEAPAQLDDAEAAAFFYPFHLASLGLFERGRVAAGETVLIHAAAGGVGSAAVQLAAASGAHVLATVGSDDKAEFVRELGADVAINYRRDAFDEVVLAETGGRGVDACFDGVGGETMTRSLRCLANGGRHLVVGFAGGIEAEEVPMVSGRAFAFGNFDVVGVMLTYLDVPSGGLPGELAPVPVPRFNPFPTATGQRVQERLLELLSAKKIRPVVGARFPFEGLPEALERMEARSTMGRVVIGR